MKCIGCCGPGDRSCINVAALKMLTGNHSVLGGEVRRYSRQELRDHLERAGFDVRRITYTNFLLLPLVLVGTLRASAFGGHHESDIEITVPRRPVNAILAGTLALEAQALQAHRHARRQLTARAGPEAGHCPLT